MTLLVFSTHDNVIWCSSGAGKQNDQENMSKKLILVKPVEEGKTVEKFANLGSCSNFLYPSH